MAYGNFKDLNRRAAADKVQCEKIFKVAKNPKNDGYQRTLVSMVYKCFDIKTSGGTVKNENISNKEFSRRITQTNYQIV